MIQQLSADNNNAMVVEYELVKGKERSNRIGRRIKAQIKRVAILDELATPGFVIKKKIDSLSARSLLFVWPRESKSNDPILILKKNSTVSSRPGIRLDGNKPTSLFDTFHDVVSRQGRLIDDRAGAMSTTRAVQGKTNHCRGSPKISLSLVIK